ncbi:CHASE2 domain-containing protein [Massilia sp. TS11]|uniref:CHASE2 domain-containing protein n=1 Tax=Massilia sp. TS11 TaxID=2908003 RepID=UPI001EDA52F8|nr:adenylate/guanylate cyclase domain-containing protein [Massilia sp. TS11]MCG2583625.1 adenylate/guanylate cyclase domain-containing protein [Massilia sp. TS11]
MSRPSFVLIARSLIAVMAVVLTVWAQWWTAPTTSFFAGEWVRDRYLQLQTTLAPEPRILIVDIDEASLQAYGPWPWPHGRLADLAETLLGHYHARGVAFDIVLEDASDPLGEARLAALSRTGRLVLAQMFDYSSERPEPLRKGQLAGASSAHAQTAAVPATGYLANHASVVQHARQVGNLGFVPDSDGALRRLPLFTSWGGQRYPTLGVALVDCCSGPGSLVLPREAFMRVGLKRDWPAYYLVSAAEILKEEIDPASCQQCLIIVGSSSLGLGDRVTTPLAENRPGVWVHAAMTSTLLDLKAGTAPPPWPGRWIALAYALAATLVASFAFARLSALANVGLLALSAAGWMGLAFVVSRHDAEFGLTGPLATHAWLLAVGVPFHWQLTQRRSRHLFDTLRQYVAPAVVDELLRSDVKDPLTPRLRDVTTLIADMEGYTTQVEQLPVDEAAKLTRDFLDCLTGPVFTRHGTIDKYTGDGLVAFWGAPLPNAEHADLALDAAEDIVRRVAVLSAARVAAGRPPLRVRIGIDSGPAMAGDFGTQFRSVYTAVGDSVNTASRLEQAARDFPHCVIIGAGTVERAKRHQFLPLGERLLRGKEKPTQLFTLATPEAA